MEKVVNINNIIEIDCPTMSWPKKIKFHWIKLMINDLVWLKLVNINNII